MFRLVSDLSCLCLCFCLCFVLSLSPSLSFSWLVSVISVLSSSFSLSCLLFRFVLPTHRSRRYTVNLQPAVNRQVLSCFVWVVLAVIWHRFCSSWRSFWIVFGCLGRYFGSLGVSWRPLGGSWSVLGWSWGRFVDPSQQIPPQRAAWDRFSAHLGRPRRPQDGSKTAPWRLKTAQEDAKTEPKTNKNRSENRPEKRSPARTLLRRSWGDLGSILGSSWARFWPFSIGNRRSA